MILTEENLKFLVKNRIRRISLVNMLSAPLKIIYDDELAKLNKYYAEKYEELDKLGKSKWVYAEAKRQFDKTQEYSIFKRLYNWFTGRSNGYLERKNLDEVKRFVYETFLKDENERLKEEQYQKHIELFRVLLTQMDVRISK